MHRNRLVSRVLTFVLLVWLPIAAHSQTAVADGWCGTRLQREDIPLILERQAAGLYDLPADDLDAPKNVAVAFHIVRSSAGQGGLNPAVLPMILADLKGHFAGVVFCDPYPIDYIDSDEFYTGIDTLLEIDTLRSTNVVADAINVYFTENLASEQGSIGGISSFSDGPIQGIVMDNQYTPAAGNHATVTHEVGH